MFEQAIQWLERIKYWHGRVAKFDDLVDDETTNTRTALFNLKIENSRNKKHPSQLNAIDPIIASLQNTVQVLNKDCKELKSEGREELTQCTENLMSFFENLDIEKIKELAMKDYAEDLVEEFQQVMICEGKITMKDVIDILQLNEED